jgi:hypothetical protein
MTWAVLDADQRRQLLDRAAAAVENARATQRIVDDVHERVHRRRERYAAGRRADPAPAPPDPEDRRPA